MANLDSRVFTTGNYSDPLDLPGPLNLTDPLDLPDHPDFPDHPDTPSSVSGPRHNHFLFSPYLCPCSEKEKDDRSGRDACANISQLC